MAAMRIDSTIWKLCCTLCWKLLRCGRLQHGYLAALRHSPLLAHSCLQPDGSMRTAVTSQKPCLCLTIPVVRCSFDPAACAIQLETPDFVPAFQLHVGDLTMGITSPDIIQANSFVMVSRTSSLRTAKVLVRDSDDDSRPKMQECHNRGFGDSTQTGAV